MAKRVAVHFLGYFPSKHWLNALAHYVRALRSVARIQVHIYAHPHTPDLCETLSRQESFLTRLAAKPEMCLKRKQETEATSKMFSGKFI